MKKFYLSIATACFSFILNAQVCQTVYRFNPDDQVVQKIIGGQFSGTTLLDTGKICAIQSRSLTIPYSESNQTLFARGVFGSSANLDPTDFIWIRFQANGVDIRSKVIRGKPGVTEYAYDDSVVVLKNTKVSVRISLICNSADELWSLEKDQFEICTPVKMINEFKKKEPSANIEIKSPGETLQIEWLKNATLLKWKTEPAEDSNFFRVERSSKNAPFRLIGMVKENSRKDRPGDYIFTDAENKDPKAKYRIVRVTDRGSAESLGEISMTDHSSDSGE